MTSECDPEWRGQRGCVERPLLPPEAPLEPVSGVWAAGWDAVTPQAWAGHAQCGPLLIPRHRCHSPRMPTASWGPLSTHGRADGGGLGGIPGAAGRRMMPAICPRQRARQHQPLPGTPLTSRLPCGSAAVLFLPCPPGTSLISTAPAHRRGKCFSGSAIKLF